VTAWLLVVVVPAASLYAAWAFVRVMGRKPLTEDEQLWARELQDHE
jgi:hypothetical protein